MGLLISALLVGETDGDAVFLVAARCWSVGTLGREGSTALPTRFSPMFPMLRVLSSETASPSERQSPMQRDGGSMEEVM